MTPREQRNSGGVFCPKCGGRPCKVVDSRTPLHRKWIFRRRECTKRKCGHRFSTREVYAEQAQPETTEQVMAIIARAILQLRGELNALGSKRAAFASSERFDGAKVYRAMLKARP